MRDIELITLELAALKKRKNEQNLKVIAFIIPDWYD